MSDIALHSKMPAAQGAVSILRQIGAGFAELAQCFGAARRVAAALDENGTVARADLQCLGINPDSFGTR